MGELFLRRGLMVILMVCSPVPVMAQSEASSSDPALPSEAMLEFLGDLNPLDEETWQLLEHHALRDVAETKEVNTE